MGLGGETLTPEAAQSTSGQLFLTVMTLEGVSLEEPNSSSQNSLSIMFLVRAGQRQILVRLGGLVGK